MRASCLLRVIAAWPAKKRNIHRYVPTFFDVGMRGRQRVNDYGTHHHEEAHHHRLCIGAILVSPFHTVLVLRTWLPRFSKHTASQHRCCPRFVIFVFVNHNQTTAGWRLSWYRLHGHYEVHSHKTLSAIHCLYRSCSFLFC